MVINQRNVVRPGRTHHFPVSVSRQQMNIKETKLQLVDRVVRMMARLYPEL